MEKLVSAIYISKRRRYVFIIGKYLSNRCVPVKIANKGVSVPQSKLEMGMITRHITGKKLIMCM